jgi:hypothetical protein
MGASSAKAYEDERSPLSGRMTVVHCHECWRYTDDKTYETNLAQHAVTIICNATPAMEQTEAYSSAVDFLASRFKAGMTPPGLRGLRL